MKFQMRERMFSVGDDHWITTEHGDKAFLVDGKVLRISDTFELKDVNGVQVAVIKKKLITPFHDKYEAKLEDGREWEVSGNFLEHEFEIEDENGSRLAKISKKWFSVRDTYGIQIEDDADVPLLLCIAVCVDHLQRDEHHA